ncbi:MAG TPA: zinc-dependent metalloprotease, partial [Actinomycetota bacterium]|nr:zinc-dependent metalloprotease [Actinomycetota bacterium]
TAPPQRVEVVRRARWVESNLTGLRPLFEPVANRMSELLRSAREQESPGAAEGGMMIEAVLGQLGPLLMGAQVGTVMGQLGTRVLGNYDLPVPRDEPSLHFVVPNIAAFEKEWSLEPDEFRAWVAMHEVAHATGLHRPWVRGHVVGLVKELAEGMELDLSGLEARLGSVDPSNPQALSEALGDPSELFGGEPTGERKILADRLRAFVIAAEGHAGHVLLTVGRHRLSSFARIEEAMRRRHEDRSQEERMADRLLGLELEPDQYRLGERFCETVEERTDAVTLARMWDSAEAFPSMPELEEPTLWLSRTA